MNPPDWKTCTEKELWRYVASHLARRGIDTVLVGGAVAAVYSDGVYKSGDLDLVPLSDANREKTEKAMAEIGFKKSPSRYFVHPECRHLFVEFVTPPLALGDDTDIRPRSVRVDGVPIRILNPTDCVRDRLASFIHFKARECLDQALLVARRHRVDLGKIRKWCAQEGGKSQLREFEMLLKGRSRPSTKGNRTPKRPAR